MSNPLGIGASAHHHIVNSARRVIPRAFSCGSRLDIFVQVEVSLGEIASHW